MNISELGLLTLYNGREASPAALALSEFNDLLSVYCGLDQRSTSDNYHGGACFQNRP